MRSLKQANLPPTSDFVPAWPSLPVWVVARSADVRPPVGPGSLAARAGWLADPVQGTADRGGNSTRHPGHVERSPTGDLARDEVLPLEVEAEQRSQVGSPVHPDACSTLVDHPVVISCLGVEQRRHVEPAVADVASPVARGRVRPASPVGGPERRTGPRETPARHRHTSHPTGSAGDRVCRDRGLRGRQLTQPGLDVAGAKSGCPSRADVSVHRPPAWSRSSSIARSCGAGTPSRSSARGGVEAACPVGATQQSPPSPVATLLGSRHSHAVTHEQAASRLRFPGGAQ